MLGPLARPTRAAPLLRAAARRCASSSSAPAARGHVKIVEVSPRDGLQNEAQVVPTATKLELVRRLVAAGATCVEAGSFVSPKWVPQMADSPQILQQIAQQRGVSYPFLVPNGKGLDALLDIAGPRGSAPGQTDEIAIFTAATDAFARANTNCSVAESLERLAPVTQRALDAGLRVRGYISVVGGCPYQGAVDPANVGAISKALLDMGCYEVSLGDTVGVATPAAMLAVLNECTRHAPAERFAAHCHDTFGTGLANVLACVDAGVRTVDAAVGGLGGCPYSPGATGNIDTESVVYALHESGYSTGMDLDALARIGGWISGELSRPNGSSAGRALLARAAKAERDSQKEARAKL